MEPSTKKRLLIGMVVAAGVLLLAAVVWYLAFVGQFAAYQDGTYGFTIKYPRSWQKAVHPQPGAAVVFVSPKETALDAFQENVNIAVADVPPELATLKSFSAKILEQMTKVFKNIKVVESREVTFGGRRGYRVVFVADKPDAVTILNEWTIKGGDKSYILTYMAMTRQYKTYLPLVEEMIKSFHLK